jgi:hypothetical protein
MTFCTGGSSIVPDRKLARPIALADGRTLKSMSDAVAIIEEHFAAVTRDKAHEHAIKLLIRANAGGKRADIGSPSWSTTSSEHVQSKRLAVRRERAPNR